MRHKLEGEIEKNERSEKSLIKVVSSIWETINSIKTSDIITLLLSPFLQPFPNPFAASLVRLVTKFSSPSSSPSPLIQQQPVPRKQ